jgi:peroxiredoxin
VGVLFLEGKPVKSMVGLALALALAGDLKVGDEVPDTVFKGVCGKELKLSELNKEEKVVVLVSWSVECGSGAVPRLNDIVRQFAEQKKVQFIGVSAYGDSAGRILEYLREKDLKYPVMHDADKAVSKMLGAKRANLTYVIAGGKLFYRGAVMKNGKDKVAEAIEAALGGKPAPESDQDKAG